MTYMTLVETTKYIKSLNLDGKFDLKDIKNIDGTLYIDTTAVKTMIGAEAFRLMECYVPTSLITYNDIVLMGLWRKAAEQMEKYPQYAGHEKKYVLGKALVECVTKSGMVFYTGENILVEPRDCIREFVDNFGKQRRMIFVWSMNNRCATSVDVSDIEWVDNYLPF